MAKNVFNEIGANYKVIELDEHNEGRQLQEALAHMTGARTVRALCSPRLRDKMWKPTKKFCFIYVLLLFKHPKSHLQKCEHRNKEYYY